MLQPTHIFGDFSGCIKFQKRELDIFGEAAKNEHFSAKNERFLSIFGRILSIFVHI